MLMLCSCLAVTAALGLPAAAGAAVDLPPGFQQRTVFSGLTYPTAARFAPDGRVFVAEKSGRILAYSGSTTSPRRSSPICAGRSTTTATAGFWASPSTRSSRPGRTSTRCTPATRSPAARRRTGRRVRPTRTRTAPEPPQVSAACIVSGRLVKITVDPATNVAVGAPQTLVDDWCSEFLSHSRRRSRVWGRRAGCTRAAATGGLRRRRLRPEVRQPVQRPAPEGQPGRRHPGRCRGRRAAFAGPAHVGDPAGLDGAIIRVDPDTGAASPGNPLASHPDANARRIVADGLRNPFRFAVRPGSGDLWVGDVGWGSWEEVNRLPNPAAPGASKRNFGWPCYEGDALPGSRQQDLYSVYGLGICSGLYAEGEGAVTAPTYSYFHDTNATDPSLCEPARAGALESFKTGSSVTGMAFYTTGDYGSEYDGGLFFADYTRRCIWFMGLNEDGPDPAKVKVFAEDADFPIDVQRGPGGDVFYVDIVGGEVHRIERSTLTVSLGASQTHGAAPLPVTLTATAGGNQGALSYTWDLDGDGTYGDQGQTGATVNKSFAQQIPGVKVRVRVTDAGTGQVSTSKPVLIAAGDVHRARRADRHRRRPRARGSPARRSTSRGPAWTRTSRETRRRRAACAGTSSSSTARAAATSTSCARSRAPTPARSRPSSTSTRHA